MRELDLAGCYVLVVEDDYFIASDTAWTLQCAGAKVMGPSPTEEAARAELKAGRPDAAIVDINLGLGPSFGLAKALRKRGIPFVFITGYDKRAIPVAYGDVDWLQKPVQSGDIVQAVSKLVTRSVLRHA